MKKRHVFESKIQFIYAFLMVWGFVCGAVMVHHSGVIYGLNEDIDKQKQTLKADLKKQQCYEGKIIDCHEVAITDDTKSEKGKDAYCLFPQAYGWLLGYHQGDEAYGLRADFSEYLWHQNRNGYGDTMQLTIDDEMQVYAYEILSNFSSDGSIIVLDNQTGAVKSFVSLGTVVLDINEDIALFKEEANEIDTAYLRRGTSENDPPGSCWKLVTAAAAYSSDGYIDFDYDDDGAFNMGNGYYAYNYGGIAYGKLDLAEALSVSSNTYFANLGVQVGTAQLKKTYDALLIGQDLDFDFASITSSYYLDGSLPLTAQTSFGQGQLEITPLHLAMIGQTLANNGKMMKPYVVSKISRQKKTVYQQKPEVLSDALSKKASKKVLKAAHEAALDYGFDKDTYGNISAKTGTAETVNGIHTYLLAMGKNYTYLLSTTDSQTSNELIAPMQQLIKRFH